MSLHVDFHVNDDLRTSSTPFASSADPFVTLDLSVRGGDVTVYLRKASDIQKIIEAANKALVNLYDVELDKRMKEAEKKRLAELEASAHVGVVEADSVLESLLAEEEENERRSRGTWTNG